MNISEIIKESLTYPFNNISGLIIYLILSIIAGTVLSLTAVSSAMSGKGNLFAFLLAIIGFIICIILYLVIDGYALDIVKLGIRRADESPSIDFARQAANGLKLIVIQIVYALIPLIVFAILLLFLAPWLATLIFLILLVIFALGGAMAECRLAETDELAHALSVGDAINDVFRVGLFNLLITLVVLIIIATLIMTIVFAIFGQTSLISSIISAIITTYFLFAGNRAIGLLYSNI